MAPKRKASTATGSAAKPESSAAKKSKKVETAPAGLAVGSSDGKTLSLIIEAWCALQA
jgi:hypothetical protein